MSVGEAWRQKVALSVLGESKSDLIPDTLWLGFRTATGDIAGRVEVDTGTGWAGEGDGVSNTVPIEGGEPGPAIIVEAVLWDAATDGNPVLAAILDEPVEVTNELVTFPVGGLFFEVA